MTEQQTPQPTDREAISEVIRLERYLRDHRRWAELADCYAADSHVRTTWFDGTGQDFVAASKLMAEQRGRESRHLVTPTYIRVHGDRALCDSYGEIHNRSEIEGVEVDSVMYCRFFSRLVRTESGWRLASFDGIYNKDQIWAVDPSQTLPLDYSQLSGFRSSYRVWAYMLRRTGYEVGMEELGDDRPDLLEPFFAAAQAWLVG